MKLHVDKDTCVQKGGAIGRETVSLFQFSDDKIDFTYKCQTCDCNENKILNAPECSTKGTLICGVCQCNEGFKGNICTKGLFSYVFIVFYCALHVTYIQYFYPKWQGRYCECEEGKQTSNDQCSTGDCQNGGKCFCGKCECKPGFDGDCCQINVNDVREEFCDPEGTVTTCHGM